MAVIGNRQLARPVLAVLAGATLFCHIALADGRLHRTIRLHPVATAELDIEPDPIGADEMRRKMAYTTLTGVAVITIWGVWKWDYFTRSPHSKSEGWFGNNTKSGGADKLGHLYSSYLAAHGLSALYERWSFDKDDAAIFGALTSFAIMGYMELGDSFSDYGFSHEDFIANTIGCVLAYLMYKDTRLAAIFDIRWEYGFTPDNSDFVTDYENSKYLLALKLNGFESMQGTYLRHIEFHLGYYTRGFSDNDPNRERNLYVGIGFNLTDFLRRRGHHKTATVFNYVQLPFTSATHSHDLND